MLKISHISKTFNPGTVNEKKAIEDLSLELKQGDFATIIGSNGAGILKSPHCVLMNQHFLMQSAVIFLQMPVRSSWMAGISHLCRSMHVQEALDGFIRIRCVELHRA